MRKIIPLGIAAAALLAPGTSAIGADLSPIVAAPVAPVVVDPWTGFFVGFHGGGGAAKKIFVDNFPVYDGEIDAQPKLKGWLAGLQAGANYQFGWLLVGAEGDFSWTKFNSDFSCFSFGDQICGADTQWTATLTGKVGAAIGPALVYVKGGGAWVHDAYTNIATCAGAQPIFKDGIFADCGDLYNAKETRPGWLWGVGFEYLLGPHWSMKVEYNHMHFNKRSITFTDEDNNYFTEEIHQKVDVIKAGFNYRFNPWVAPAPVLASGGEIYTKAPARVNESGGETVLAFSTVDVAKRSLYGWAGAIFAPGTFDNSGLRVYLLGGAGRYSYPADVADGKIVGRNPFGEALAGYGIEGENYTINLLAGFSATNHTLSQPDPENSVQGTAGGFTVRGSAYSNPTTRTMVYGEAEYTTAFKTFITEGKAGYDVFGVGSYFGPYAYYFKDERSDQWRVGGHLSEISVGTLKVDIDAGYLRDSIVGSGAFGRLTVSKYF
jgi:outer membrane immunogenic protein